MTLREFYEYVAYWDKEPFGDELRMLGQISWMIYTANGGQRQRRLKVEDFMPHLVKHQSGDQVVGALLAWQEAIEKTGQAV